ncbi:MAG: fibronectin type III domain-containing protein [Acidobacteriota bacterium]|nr:MAG: fibronectin type III domain-containing protein [Acidobacteriota bacterium]
MLVARQVFVACALATLLLVPASADSPLAPRTTRFSVITDAAQWPADLDQPDSKTRWFLEHVPSARILTLLVQPRAEAVEVTRRLRLGEQESVETRRFFDPNGGDAALSWWLPDRIGQLRRPGERTLLRLIEERDGRRDELRIEIEGVALGWAHLPIGPREVVVERATVLRRRGGSAGFEAEAQITRFIGGREGLLAEIVAPYDETPASASVVDELIDGAADLKIYVDDVQPFSIEDASCITPTGAVGFPCQLNYGFDRGEGTTISQITPDGFSTVGQLINKEPANWDFSVNVEANSVAEQTSTTFTLSAENTCNFGLCGYVNPATRVLSRQDKDFYDASTTDEIINTVFEREDRGAPDNDVVQWIRAGAQKEGDDRGFGNGESSFCYDPTFDAEPRSPVAQWVFSHQDADGFFFQAGDSWETSFDCEQNIYNRTCGERKNFLEPPDLWSKPCDCPGTGCHEGKQSGQVVRGGVVTLPSGHTVNTLVVRIVADFCVYSCAECDDTPIFGCRQDEVRKVVYLWVAPGFNTVARIQSDKLVANIDTWGDATEPLEETDFKFGLYPPLTIESTATTDDSVSLTWDPGQDTRRIDDFVVYWDADSGAVSDYALNSVTHAADVTFDGTSATIANLAAGTEYFFTVTSRSTHVDMKTGVPTQHESLLYPSQVFGDPDHVYPIEILATTSGQGCAPSTEVTGLVLSKQSSGGIELCWQPVDDPCLSGYDIVASDDASSAAGWTTIGGTGLETCWTGDPAETFFLVIARGAGGQGPWNHFGR